MEDDYGDAGWSMTVSENGGSEERRPDPVQTINERPPLQPLPLAPVPHHALRHAPLEPPIYQATYSRVPMQAPMGQWDGENGHMLGLSILATGLGTAAGAVYGGLGGSIAGALAAGSGVNLVRAYKYYVEGTEPGKKEAVVSGTYAILAGAAAAAVWWKFGRHAKMVRNPDDVREEREAQGYCAIRKVGP